MMLFNLIKSSRLFLYVGFMLIILGIAILPANVRVVVQPNMGETEQHWLGPIFAIMIGIWSLPNLFLGVIESSTSKKAVLWLASILFPANVVLAFSIMDAARFWHNMLFQWLLSYGLILTPCILVNLIGLLYLLRGEKLTQALKNSRIRIISICFLMIAPLLITIIFYYMWLASTFY